MARKSKELDKKLIKTALKMISKAGASNLPLREVAKKANVNLGMFNYYFKNKEDFINKVLHELYHPFIEDLNNSYTSNEGLELILFKMTKFSQDNKKLILTIIKDILSEDASTLRFVKKNFSIHFEILSKALNDHFFKKKITNYEPQLALRFTVSAIGLTNILCEVQSNIFKHSVEKLENDDQLRVRAKATIKALEYMFNA